MPTKMEPGKIYKIHQPKSLLAVAEDIDRIIFDATKNNLDDTLAALVRLHQQIISSILEEDGKGESMLDEQTVTETTEEVVEVPTNVADEVSSEETAATEEVDASVPQD